MGFQIVNLYIIYKIFNGSSISVRKRKHHDSETLGHT